MRPNGRNDRRAYPPAASGMGNRKTSNQYGQASHQSTAMHYPQESSAASGTQSVTEQAEDSGEMDSGTFIAPYGSSTMQMYPEQHAPQQQSMQQQPLPPHHHHHQGGEHYTRHPSVSTYVPTYLTQPTYAHYQPQSSAREVPQQFSGPTGDMNPNLPQEVPPRAVSPDGQSDTALSDAYYMPFPPGTWPSGQRFYVQAGVSPSPAAYPQAQYQQQVYGMQYYPQPYTQGPTFYGADRPTGGWVNAPHGQHAWRPPAYHTYGGQPMSSFSRSTPTTRPRMPSGPASNMPTSVGGSAGTAGPLLQNAAASRSASSSSRTSPGSLNSQQQPPRIPQLASTPLSSTADVDVSVAAAQERSHVGLRGTSTAQLSQAQGPRSEFVMWCGNVPANATENELWNFFAHTSGAPAAMNREQSRSRGDAEAIDPKYEEDGSIGVLSIFLISRSNCAFVNFDTHENLQRALAHFQGLSLRPHDPRCPKLVCRVRKKGDEAQAGVGGQRGRGIHVAWLKDQERKAKEERLAQQKRLQIEEEQATTGLTSATLPQHSTDLPDLTDSSAATPSPTNNGASLALRPSIDHSSSGSGSVSYASTNSSLFRHPAFRERFFILKSLKAEDLDQSVKTGLWATQAHNEAVLDQAFRNSEHVYLIFSANQSGGFYGYARMTSAIQPSTAGAAEKGGASAVRPTSIPEHEEEDTTADMSPKHFKSQAHLTLPQGGDPLETESPQQLTPATESEEPMLKSPRGRSQSASGATVSAPARTATGSVKNVQSVLQTAPTPPVTIVSPTPEAGSTPPEEHPMSAAYRQGSTIVVSPMEETLEDPITSGSVSGGESSLGSVSSEPIRRAVGLRSPPRSDAASISPSESASYPADSRSQGQLAIRALIHNLRLDEKETAHRTKQLEALEEKAREKEVTGVSSDEVDYASRKTVLPLVTTPESRGKFFKIEWIKVQPLDFQRVRKFRNPWRDNRQVKVSRDGTELEPNVGRQMLEEWNKTEKNVAPATSPSIASYEASAARAEEQVDEDEDQEP